MATKTAKKKSITKNELVVVALDVATELGWAYVTLNDIADKAEISLACLHDHFDDKSDILVALGRMIDRRVLESFEDIGGEASTRDRLFDVLMERFDILNDYRDGVVAVLHSFRFDPKDAVISAPHLCRSMAWMLEASGVETNGIKGGAKIVGITGVYLKVLKVWKDDTSPDLGKTMAALDKHLEQAERLANRFGV
ncbi:MAG: TetR/AcrR family transcriptional regulator [Alphaproteobacteria bacterium]|nr:TetR/AcrR family transcriptional regulator [Alphaproteobacteria bacterium]